MNKLGKRRPFVQRVSVHLVYSLTVNIICVPLIRNSQSTRDMFGLCTECLYSNKCGVFYCRHSRITYRSFGRSRGGVPGACSPRKGPDSFISIYKSFERNHLGSRRPLREILDPPMRSVLNYQIIYCILRKSQPKCR